MNILIYNTNVLILNRFKDKLRDNIYWILQLRDIRSDSGHYEHSNRFIGFHKNAVFINQVKDFSRRLFYEVK